MTHLADPLGMLGEENLERLQLLRHTLDVVQAINTNHDLDHQYLYPSLLPCVHTIFPDSPSPSFFSLTTILKLPILEYTTHLAPLKPLLQSPNPINHLGLPNHIRKLRRVNTDRERPDLGIPAFKLDTVRHRLESEDTSTGREKVSGIVVCVESDKVALEDTE